ncbi:MAG: tRNA guanosine(34) transglycosylase Tgt [Alphaproteobacteria bacterium CG_4_10_14_0_8_um_filter_37_21]|nr:MAG: tRNA guanosine(34) transglycosylase Tgt [Alphaproteobacteria bacterium CG_4_10_14_0_8_um_filter_37_21]
MTDFSFNYKTFPHTKARIGKLETPHGTIETPAFIFCATKAAIKGVSPKQMRDAGTQIILSNTYHLMLQPGGETVHKLGGLQKMTGWNGPMLTDSGGFQIFSLGHGSVSSEIKGKRDSKHPKTMLKVTEEGAKFKSYTDGSIHLLTPEIAIQTQVNLGADLIVVLDECTPFHVDKSYTRASMNLSHRWAVRSATEFNRITRGDQRLYGIVQGGVYQDLRTQACDFLNSQPFFGHAVGGSLGASQEQMYDIVSYTMEKLCDERPVHLLGIGGIRDIYEGVQQGIDTFDCVHPTRLARHGGALVRPCHNHGKAKEHINLKNAAYTLDTSPIEPDCDCETCKNYSKGYIQHLLKAKELLALTLISIHNIAFMNRYLKAIRKAIESNTLEQLKKDWVQTP